MGVLNFREDARNAFDVLSNNGIAIMPMDGWLFSDWRLG